MLHVVPLPYDPSRARDLASAASQIVPVLLLAALAVPLLQRPDTEEEQPSAATANGQAPRRLRPAMELLLTIACIGASAITEFAALYGVYYRLVPHDVHFLTVCLEVTGLLAAARVLMPILEHYKTMLRVPEAVLWLAVLIGSIVVGLGLAVEFG